MNSFAPVDPQLVDVTLPEFSGYSGDFEAEDTTDAIRDACGDAARDFPQSLWIEPSQWVAKARENDEHNTWPMNYIDRYTWQGNSHECVCHSLRAGVECARNRQRGVIYPEGPKKDFRYPESAEYGSVWLSPLSVYSEGNPNVRGGMNVRRGLEIAVRRGMLPEKVQPRAYGFRHSIVGTAGGKSAHNQSNGPWVALSDFPAGWEQTAAWFKPLEIIFPESWEQCVCLVLHGYVVHVGRKGHAVPWAQWNSAEQVMAYPDSYRVTRYDSISTVKGAWRGACSIATVTAPDDWLEPAA